MRVEAYGAVDELNAAIGLARANTDVGPLRARLEGLQKELVVLMGELATAVEDLPRYGKDGYPVVSAPMTAALEQWIREVETAKVFGKEWAIPGANTSSATLDLARAVCRRAERRVCTLKEADQLSNPEIMVYLNRLSDLLWLLARSAEVA